jgi:hypothetical protein
MSTALNIGATAASLLFGRILIPLVPGLVKGSADLFNMLLYYTEGLGIRAITDVELTRRRFPASPPSSCMWSEQRGYADSHGSLRDQKHRDRGVRDSGVTTLGDYFQSDDRVRGHHHILALLLLFTVLRLLIRFLIAEWNTAAADFRCFRTGMASYGAGLGLIHGVLLVFVIFLIAPVLLTSCRSCTSF